MIWNAVIGRNNLIGRGTSVCPLATTGKCVRVGPYGLLGSSSAIADDLTLGPMVAVAMNALLTRDVGPGMFVFGNPARILGRDTVPAPLIEDWEKQLRDFPPAALEEGAGRARNGGAA